MTEIRKLLTRGRRDQIPKSKLVDPDRLFPESRLPEKKKSKKHLSLPLPPSPPLSHMHGKQIYIHNMYMYRYLVAVVVHVGRSGNNKNYY